MNADAVVYFILQTMSTTSGVESKLIGLARGDGEVFPHHSLVIAADHDDAEKKTLSL